MLDSQMSSLKKKRLPGCCSRCSARPVSGQLTTPLGALAGSSVVGCGEESKTFHLVPQLRAAVLHLGVAAEVSPFSCMATSSSSDAQAI